MIYVIMSPGRTGSTFLLNAMGRSIEAGPGGVCNAIQYRYPTDADAIKLHDPLHNMVIHTHNLDVFKKLNLDTSKVTVILSTRDVLETFRSFIVALITDEWGPNEYSYVKPTPVEFDVATAVRRYRTIKSFYIKFDYFYANTEFAKLIRIDYKDIEFNSQFVADALGITDYVEDDALQKERPSPYTYHECVSNWGEIEKALLV